MLAQTQTRAGSTVTRCVLTAVLLALAVLLGTTALESASPSPAAASSTASHVEAALTMATTPAAEPVAQTVVANDHIDGPVNLLCLCALLVAGVGMLTRGGAPWRLACKGAYQGGRDRMEVAVLGRTPTLERWGVLMWGVCRR